MAYFNEALQKARELYYPPPKKRKTKSKNMATKTKSPPKVNAADVTSMLKLVSKNGYSTKMSNLLNFLNQTSPIRTGAEIVETDVSITQDGSVMSLRDLQEDYINEKMRFKFHEEEMSELNSKLQDNWNEQRDQHTIIRRKNTDAKKAKAEARIKELEAEDAELKAAKKELEDKIKAAEEAERARLKAAMEPQPFSTQPAISVQEMRELLMLYTGCKIKVSLQTGSYTFPVPVGTPFYREVCNILGLPLENQEPAEKPVIKRMFTMPADVLQAIRSATTFASKDDLRPAMTCVMLEINEGKMLVVATDAHRLFKSREFEVAGPPGQYNYLLPVSALRRLPKAVNEDFTIYELKGEKVGICGLTIELMDARFPDWKVVMPKYESGVTFNRWDMIDAVKNTLPYANKSTGQINFNFNGEILISAQDIDFSFETSNRMRYLNKTMEDLVIAFNGKFFIEALNTFKTDEVLFQGETPTRAGILTDGQDTVLIMPLMLND